MKWRKLGRIFDPEVHLPPHPKLISHAANPLAVQLEGDLYRIFFSARDAKKRSSVGAVDLDLSTQKIIRTLPIPVMEHGPKGSFFADGISVGCVYATQTTRYLLFMAWQVPPDAHWRGEIGRFRLNDDLSLCLDPDRAYLALDVVDSVSLSYPWVTHEADGFAMYYGTTLTWDAGNCEMTHVLRKATSADGEHWVRRAEDLPHVVDEAQAFSRPTVVPAANGGQDMWFSYRGAPGRGYRIGHAHRSYLGAWELRNARAGIDVSESGWDSEMIEYPFVFDHGDRRLMLYNGNDYGRSGFGLAELES